MIKYRYHFEKHYFSYVTLSNWKQPWLFIYIMHDNVLYEFMLSYGCASFAVTTCLEGQLPGGKSDGWSFQRFLSRSIHFHCYNLEVWQSVLVGKCSGQSRYQQGESQPGRGQGQDVPVKGKMALSRVCPQWPTFASKTHLMNHAQMNPWMKSEPFDPIAFWNPFRFQQVFLQNQDHLRVTFCNPSIAMDINHWI